MALPSGPTVLPFKSEAVSFSLTYKSAASPTAHVELACVCFGRDAQVLDFVDFNRRAALNSALKHSACSYLPPKDAAPGGADEAVHMLPFELSPQCEVMLLLASAPASPLLRNDLGTSGRLQFRVHARELGGQPLQLLDVDLSPLVAQPPRARRTAAQAGAAQAASPSPSALSNGHQTMAIAAVSATPAGWTLSFDCSTFSEDHWGLLLPQLRALLQRWPALSAAAAAALAGPRLLQQVVVSSRKGADSALGELAATLAAREAAAAAAAARRVPLLIAEASSDADADAAAAGDIDASAAAAAAADAPAVSGRASPTAAAASADPAASVEPLQRLVLERLVLELGWDVYAPRPAADEDEDGGGEEDEEPMVDFALGVYNLQGEELVTLNVDNPLFDGVTIEDEPDAEEEEDELGPEEEGSSAGVEAAAAAAGAEAAAAGASEGGEDEAGAPAAADADAAPAAAGSGEEDDESFVKEDEAGDEDELKQESPEARAARIAAAAEAAAAAAQAAAANQRPLSERFPLKRRIQLVLPEMAPDARALVLSMTCFSAGGFKNVKTLQARLVLAAPQAAGGAEPEAAAAAAGQGGEEEEGDVPKKKKGRKQPPKVLVHHRFDSVQGADGHLSQLLVLKLYREYPDSAFAVWAQHKVPDVASLLGGAAGVEAAGAAAGAAGPAAAIAIDAVPTERAKDVLQQALAARKQLEAELADRRAKAEEEGLALDEDEEGGELDLRMAKGVWRVRVLGVSAGGASPEDITPTLTNLLAYDGDVDAAGVRCSPACKVAYPNRDTYFGPYAAPGVKAGIGLYVAASGAAFIGQHGGGGAGQAGGQSGRRCGFGLMVLPDGGQYKGGFRDDRFEGQGTYLYPDHSLYTGSWKAGRKHGQGTYWDSAGGCLRGEWAAGQLRGSAQYDQPSYHFEGRFAKGLPAGPCSFALSSEFRTAGLPAAAASHIIAPHGPTLQGEGKYALPPGVADTEPEGGEEGAEEAGDADDDEAAQLPAWPKYEGLGYQSAVRPPCSVADLPFPPPAAPMAAI